MPDKPLLIHIAKLVLIHQNYLTNSTVYTGAVHDKRIERGGRVKIARSVYHFKCQQIMTETRRTNALQRLEQQSGVI